MDKKRRGGGYGPYVGLRDYTDNLSYLVKKVSIFISI